MFGKQKISEGAEVSVSFGGGDGCLSGLRNVATDKISGSSTTRHNRAADVCQCGGRLVRLGTCFSCLSCGWGGCS